MHLPPRGATPSPDLVACVGGFPSGYRPTERAGEVLAEPDAFTFWTCDVERSQPLTEREAFALYPELLRFISTARAALAESVGLPPGVAR